MQTFLTKSVQILIKDHFLLLLSIIVPCLLVIYFANYIRICYYMSKIPGPRAYPIFGNGSLTLGKTLEEMTDAILELVRDYPKTLRIWFGPVPAVIISGPADIQEIVTNRNSLEKPWIMLHIGLDFMQDTILTSEVPKWKQNRGHVIKGFTPVVLKSYFKIFLEKSLILTDLLAEQMDSGKSFDIFNFVSRTTMDAVCGSTMGINMNAQKEESPYFHAVQRIFILSFDRLLKPWKYLHCIYNATRNGKELAKNKNIVWDLTSKLIEKKRKKIALEKNNNAKEEVNGKYILRKPLLDYLLDIKEKDAQFTDKQLRNEITLIVVAAYETTANALSYILLNLAAHKDIQDKVYEELCSVLVDPNRTIDWEDLPNLTYMEMVIKESMRLYPTIPFIGRELTADIAIENYVLPKGLTCLISIIALHRDKNLWPDPLTFDPERFTPENCKNRHPYAYVPFSAGPRNCIGGRYAIQFMKITLALLLMRYEFHTSLNMDQLKYEIELSLKLVGGHQVRITPRKKVDKIKKLLFKENEL